MRSVFFPDASGRGAVQLYLECTALLRKALGNIAQGSPHTVVRQACGVTSASASSQPGSHVRAAPALARVSLTRSRALHPNGHAILRAELVVIDELGFTPLHLVGANHLFRLISAAYETRSMVVTSNWPFEQWTNFLPVVTAASALLDRVFAPLRGRGSGRRFVSPARCAKRRIAH